jgi:tricorn protease
MPKLLSLLAALTIATFASSAPDTLQDARLLRFPDVHGDTVVFSYAGDLWTVPAAGGSARRLTTGEGLELFPRFSPDGRWIAFTGHYDGTSDVYVIPARGGEPRRLTYYPSRTLPERMGFDNMVLGWTPQGRVLFRGQRESVSAFVGEPYTVSPEGGPVERFPLPESGAISFSPDGKKIAYTRIFRDFRTFKRYEGGMAPDVWIYDLATRQAERVTDWKGVDTQPMWIGGAIYFMSDREDWKLNLWRYDVATKQTSRVTSFEEYDVKWPHDGGGTIAFENGGWIHLLDTARPGEPRKVAVSVPDDRRLARARWVTVENRITDYHLAPGGKRAVFTARGEVFTLPAESGDTRNVSKSQGVREKHAAWSPDGRWIAYVSDAAGEEQVYVQAQDGKGKPVALTGGAASWRFAPVWSPDSKKLAWGDRGMNLWYVDVTEKKPALVDEAEVQEITQYSWSPDSRWIAYAKALDNDLPAVFLYSLDSKKATQVTAPEARSYEPVFDPQGRYLYFLSDRDIHPTLGNFELSYTVNTPTRPYAVTLEAVTPSPFAPKSDEAALDGARPADKEKADAEKKEAAEAPASDKAKGSEKARSDVRKRPFRIDLHGLAARAVGFPVPPGNYAGLRATRDRLFYVSYPTVPLTGGDGEQKGALLVFEVDKRKGREFLNPVNGYDVAPDGSAVVYKSDSTYGIVEIKEGVKVGDGKLDLSGLRMELDPKAEWGQIFQDTWRLQRDFFYLPDMGKVDWVAMRKRYEELVPFVGHRQDLAYVLGEMVGELATGHAYVGGGDQPAPERVPVGLLGADLALDGATGLWRIARIIPGQNWVESRRSPLTEPGVNVAEGEYLLAIDGREIKAADNPYRALVQTANRTVTLLVNARPTRDGAREVGVKPIGSEQDLRYYDWVERNRKKVDEATGGRVGYVHIPNMGGPGLQEFIRQYYPQIRKQGLVVDVRYNGGGFVSEMILERLRRVVVGMGNQRGSRPSTFPTAAFNGVMVGLINAYSASDGDIFPYYFREYGLGPLIGTRTWGGVVGIRGINNLVDGGYAYIPEFGTFNMESRWILENEGVSPDIEVDNLPGDVMAGKDAQLERGIQEVLKRIEEKRPAFPPLPPPKDLSPPRP